MDASAFTADALAAAAADGDRVCLSNLVVRHRKRRGAKMFFATASAEAGWDVQLSFMTRRGGAHDDAETSARLTPEAHAAAYEGCAPGATIVKVWGALERVRAAVSSAAETRPFSSAGRAETRDADGSCGDANAFRVTKDIVCPSCGNPHIQSTRACACVASQTSSMKTLTLGPTVSTVATLRVEGVAFAPRRRGGDDVVSGSPNDDVSVDDCWLVFDMAYDDTMTEGERGALSRQVTMCVAANRRARIPFRLAVVADDEAHHPTRNREDSSAARDDDDDFDKKISTDENEREGRPADSSGAGAGAIREGSLGVPLPQNSPGVPSESRRAPRTRPERKKVDWRALPWRAWGAPLFRADAFFTDAFHASRSVVSGEKPTTASQSEPPKRNAVTTEMPERVKKRVVYLSADADEVLETIEPGDVFVIGGVVDHAPKPDVARRRFESLRATFHKTSRSSDRRDEVFVKFVTARLPLAGHVSLAKNTHLPCLAVAQTLMVFREVDRYRRAGLSFGAQSEKDEDPETETRRRGKTARVFSWPAKEGGANAFAWGETLARCPAFRCAPLRKYVRWAPPYEALNEKEGEVKPSRVTDVRALF